MINLFASLRRSKRQFNTLIAGAFLALQMPLFLLAPQAAFAAPDDNKKVYVCKYVGTPGVDERLQTGQNPIEVSVNAIQNNQWNGQVPGYFSDAHDRSYVLGYVPMSPEPNVNDCPAPVVPTTPTAVASLVPCTPESGQTDQVSVLVTNVDDTTNASVTYTVVLGGQTKTITLADGVSGSVTFDGLSVGSYSAVVTGSDNTTITSNSVTVALCEETPPEEPATPTAVANAEDCTEENGSTGEVSVVVTNTDDATNDAVTYTVVLGGQTKTITLADGASGTVTFTGLAAGSYSATISGTDDTTTTSNAVSVVDCLKVTLCHATGSQSNPYEKITISVAGAFNGHLDDNFGGTHGDHQSGEDIIPPFEYKGQTYSQNWNAAGQTIYRNDCVVEPEEPNEPATPTAVASILPCVIGSGANDIVVVTVTNTDDATNDAVTYTVVLGGQTKTITLNDGQSGSVTFSGVATGSLAASVTGDDGTTVTTNAVTVTTCEDEGEILGEIIPSGGQGAGQVETVTTPSVLADTGKNVSGAIFAALTIIGLTCALAITGRRTSFNR